MNTNTNPTRTVSRLQLGEREMMNPAISNSSPTSGATKVESTLSSEKSWRKKLPEFLYPMPTTHWAEPAKSIGNFCCILDKKYKCWEAIGPVRNISSSIFRATKDLLDQHNDYLQESEWVLFSIMFGLYMIGHDEDRSSPTLIVSCEPKKPRDKAVRLIRESGILHNFKDVLLAGTSQPPSALGQIQPLGALKAADSDFVFFSPPDLHDACGRAILVMELDAADKNQCTPISQKATIGGFVRLRRSEAEDLYCGLTVAHAFEDEVQLPRAPSDLEFSFEVQDIEICSDSDNEDETRKPSPISGYGVGARIATSLDGERPDLDWALIEIHDSHQEPANVIQIDLDNGSNTISVERVAQNILTDIQILVITSSRVQRGVLSAASTFLKSPYGVSFEEVWTVRVENGKIKNGDSGSWVIDAATGDLYGHIVAGCSESKTSYVIPAFRVLEDIKQQLGGTVTLAKKAATPTHTSWNGIEEISTGSGDPLMVLGLNSTDDEVMRQIGANNMIFHEMIMDTDRIYQALVASPSNLKPYIKKESPYSWNDLSDQAIYEAMIRLSSCRSSNPGSEKTREYWEKGLREERSVAPNPLAKWFLFRRFKEAGTSGQKRFGKATPAETMYYFVPPANLQSFQPRPSPVPDARASNGSISQAI